MIECNNRWLPDFGFVKTSTWLEIFSDLEKWIMNYASEFHNCTYIYVNDMELENSYFGFLVNNTEHTNIQKIYSVIILMVSCLLNGHYYCYAKALIDKTDLSQQKQKIAKDLLSKPPMEFVENKGQYGDIKAS